MLATKDEQLSLTVLLSIAQHVMLTTNLWVEASLANGALGQVVAILYNTTTTLPNLPLFVVVNFIGVADCEMFFSKFQNRLLELCEHDAISTILDCRLRMNLPTFLKWVSAICLP